MKGPTANLDGESANGDREENEASITSNRNTRDKEVTEAPKTRKSDQALDDWSDSMQELSFREPGEKQVEGVIEDQSRTNLLDTPPMTALGSKDYIGRLGSKKSGSHQVLDMGLSEDGDGGCGVKTFGVVVTQCQMLGRVTQLEEVMSPCNLHKDSLVNKDNE